MSRKLLRHPQRDSMSNTSRRRLGKALVDGMLLAQHGRPKERPNILRRRRQQIADGKLGMTAVYSAVAEMENYSKVHPDLSPKEVYNIWLETGFIEQKQPQQQLELTKEQ